MNDWDFAESVYMLWLGLKVLIIVALAIAAGWVLYYIVSIVAEAISSLGCCIRTRHALKKRKRRRLLEDDFDERYYTIDTHTQD